MVIPRIELNLYTIENGLLFLDHGLDGTIVTAEGHPIHQTAAFHKARSFGKEATSIINGDPVDLGEVFVGFDGAWRNYFHWICFGLPKSYFANQVLDQSAIIAVPDYQAAQASGSISYSEATYNQSLEYSGLTDRVTRLPPGIYRAEKLRFFWTDPKQPTDIIYLHQFYGLFDRILRHANPLDPGLRRIYLTRSNSVANRLDSLAARIVTETAERHGFTTVNFEGLDLFQQISIFANVDRVISPHGAGLANSLFNNKSVKLLELNKVLDDHASLRPWFYLLARGRGHRYVTLDIGDTTFSAEQIESALRILDE